MIGRFNISKTLPLTDTKGNLQLLITVSPESVFPARVIAQEIEDGEYTVTVDKPKRGRSLDQNRLLWALLEKMALHMSGGRTGDVEAFDCYLTMLERYGAKYEYFLCLPEALDGFKKIFRAVKEMERRDYNGKEMVMCKCYYGSSTFDTKEMTQLIDGVFDELERMGAMDGEIVTYREEWKGRG